MNPQQPWSGIWTDPIALGAGGQGDTFTVKSTTGLPDDAVLKLLKPQKAKDPKARRRMAQEVTNLKVLHSAGGKVPQVLDDNTTNFEDQNVPLYFAMEYVRGKTLAETVQASGSLSLPVSIGISLDLCATVKTAVKERIAHRDIKPENIVVRRLEPADALIVDFGLSFNEDEASNLTEADESLGNKFLTLPERSGPGENKRDFRSDLTGICAILFYCLTGRAPRNLRDSRGRSLHRTPEFSLKAKAQNSVQLAFLETLLDKGLHYELDLRFQTADELIERLREVLTPPARAAAEDLETVIARESAALKKNDRVTQLADMFEAAMSLRNPIATHLNMLQRKVIASKRFSLQWDAVINSSPGAYFDGDRISSGTVTVGVLNHGLLHQIRYIIVAKGSECSVIREIYEIEQNRPRVNQPLEPPLVVLRYSGDVGVDATIFLNDFEPAIIHSIGLLSKKIQGRSST